jgi:dTDP-4-dehydrorhamnose reductase
MKILIIGKNGQLGKSLNKIISKSNLDDDYVFIGREVLDLTDLKSISNFFKKNKFDIVINCAAYTQVDKAENDKTIAELVNHVAVSKIASILHLTETKLIHISTDYVFDGLEKRPYNENNITNPINSYGKSKLSGELAILKNMPMNAIIIRTSWLYSEFKNNFVKTMLSLGKANNELKIVCDEVGTPTYATDISNVILKIIKNPIFLKLNQMSKLYHFSGLGHCSWLEFADEIFKIANIKCKTLPINSEDYFSNAKRPRYSVLDSTKISKYYDIKPKNWTESLEICINEINKTHE